MLMKKADLDMIRTKNAGIERAKYVMQEMSLSESVREMVTAYRKKKLDRKLEDAYVYDQGHQQLLYELVSEGKIDIDTAVEKSGLTRQEFEEKMIDAGYRLKSV